MESKKMKKKGFTLVELLVVIAIIAMLLAILMPALGKVRQLAQRIMCGTNIGGIGKAMLTYATDDEYESFPMAGTGNARWDYGSTGAEGACSWTWSKKDTPGSTNNTSSTTPMQSTLSANLYLLIKYADVSPDQFVCPGSDEKKFEMAIYKIDTSSQNFTDLWDFGSGVVADLQTGKTRGRGHNSYCYQLPLVPKSVTTVASVYPVTGTSNPAMAVIADRNPFFDKINNPSPGTAKSGADLYEWDTSNLKVKPESIPAGNNVYHQKDGQNVLFADQHVKFEKSANCAIEMDNIYTTWGFNDTQMASKTTAEQAKLRQCGGTEPTLSANTDNYNQSANDNYLVNDYN
jgi:prepilin-type N-terminal cleavage/methylation domain-containing protein